MKSRKVIVAAREWRSPGRGFYPIVPLFAGILLTAAVAVGQQSEAKGSAPTTYAEQSKGSEGKTTEPPAASEDDSSSSPATEERVADESARSTVTEAPAASEDDSSSSPATEERMADESSSSAATEERGASEPEPSPSSAVEEQAPAEHPTPESEDASSPIGDNAANEPRINPDAIPELRGQKAPTQRSTIGLEPGAPQTTGIAGGVTPAFGTPSRSSSDWVFDVHGFFLLPLRIGINEREDAQEGQKNTVLHTPPVTPGDFATFEYTGISPDPWAQLNFSYGNEDVTATVIIAARTVSNANGFFNPADQLGINDAFITFHPKPKGNVQYNVHVGAFANRYGIMGEYDMGRYGTPLIARVSGMGATGTARFELEGMKLSTEVGVMGQLNKAPVGVEPAGWNGFTDANAGTSFALHGHAALGVTRNVTAGVHGVYTFAQDDRATTTVQKDGNISVLGADVRLSMQRFGHLYLGYALTSAQTARSVSGVLRVLNAQGGLGLMREYFGEEGEGTGRLNTFGGQYDFSLGNFLRYPRPYHGEGPDIVLSAFGLATAVSSPVEERDGVFKLKYGAATTYSFLPWMGAGVRYDRVLPDTNDNRKTHAIITSRLIFKSDWGSRDQVILQYSGYLNGSRTAPVVGYPPRKDVTVVPDAHVVSLLATMWW